MSNEPVNKKFKQLLEMIPDTKEAYGEGLITLLSVKPNTKIPNIPKGLEYDEETIKANLDVFDVTKFGVNDNIGLVRGRGLTSVLDIDGIKTLSTEQNRELKKYLLDILLTIDYPFIVQETQSKGYHCLYYTNDQGNFDLSNIFWPLERPEDFPAIIDDKTYKEEFSNQTFGRGVIEVFQKLNGFIVFAPSTTKDGEYKLLSEDYTWKQLLNKPAIHMENLIDGIFRDKGFYVRDRTIKPGHGHKLNWDKEEFNNITQITCTPEATNKLITLTVNLYKEAHRHSSKYYSSLYLGGYYSKYLTIETSEAIYDGLRKGIEENIMDSACVDHATNTALHNYEVPNYKKMTLRGVEEHNNHTPEIKRILEAIVKVIDDDKNGGIGTNNTGKSWKEFNNTLEEGDQDNRNYTNNTNNNKVYNYSNTSEGSFLTTDSDILYKISSKHIDKLNRAKQDLVNLFEGHDDRKHIKYLINGGFKHFKLPSKVETPAIIGIYDPEHVYTINKDKLYGFPKIRDIIRHNYGNRGNITFDVDNGNAKTTYEITTHFDDLDGISKVNALTEIIEEMTILNNTYYVCNGFTQIRNRVYIGNYHEGKVLGFFAFKSIKKVVPFDPVERAISKKQAYDFEIVTDDDETINYENFIIEDLVKDLYHRGLLMEDGKKTIANIIRFIMETNKKQGLRIIKRPIVPGVFYDTSNNELIYYLPELETGKYTLKEGVEAMNDIFSRIFANKIKYSTIYLAGFIQLLCNVFKQLGLHNGVNKHILLLQASNTLKTFVLDLNNHTFRHSNRFEETNTGDTKSAILRNASKSTYPQILNDPKISINSKDFTDITLGLAFGYVADEVADDQYGNKTNTRDAFRLLAVSHNEPNFVIDDEGGEARRLNIAIFTHADRPTKEQKKAINEYLTVENGDIKLNRLNAIGEAYIKFIVKYFSDFTTEKNEETYKAGAWNIIDEFLEYLEAESGVKLNKGFYTHYEWDDLTENESIKLRTRLRYNFEETLKNKGIAVNYDPDTVKEYFKLNRMFHDKKNKNKPISYVLHKEEFESFIRSPGGLNRNISAEDGLKLLGIDKEFKRLRCDTVNEANKDFRITCTPITPEEVLEAFYGEIVITDDLEV